MWSLMYLVVAASGRRSQRGVIEARGERQRRQCACEDDELTVRRRVAADFGVALLVDAARREDRRQLLQGARTDPSTTLGSRRRSSEYRERCSTYRT